MKALKYDCNQCLKTLNVITSSGIQCTVKPVYNEHPWNSKLWPLLTSDRCSKVSICYKHRKLDPKIVVPVDRWSLFGGGR